MIFQAVFLAAVLVAQHVCEMNFDCVAVCSPANCTAVPKQLPKTADCIDLSRNRIGQLHKGDFKNLILLRALNVSWNGLELIETETFLDTPHLEDLDLSHNLLKNLSGQHYLMHTGNLRVLNLAWNKVFCMKLGREFTSLEKLASLTVGAKNISLDAFKNIARLKLHVFTLSVQKEFNYESNSLKNINAQKLQIDFGGGNIMQRYLIDDALTTFPEVELRNLTGGYGHLSDVFKEKAKNITSNLSLNNFVIEWKDLTTCINLALKTSISHLRAFEAAIDKPPYADTAGTNTSSMESFTVKRGVVRSFFFSQKALYNFFINMPVKSLSIMETSIIHMTCPKKPSQILELDFSYCALSDSIFSNVKQQKVVECETLGSLRKLTIQGNNLKSLQLLSARMQFMSSLQYLDLSINPLVYDGWSACQWPPSITFMNLSSGGLTDGVFKCLPQGIETLDLQNNQISAVTSNVLQLENLTSLNLNANRLRDLPACDGFPRLNKLLLRSNSLHAPSLETLKRCPKLKTLDASHNPFTCTCTLRSFISLGIQAENTQSLELLSWPKGYYCLYPEDVKDSMLRSFWVPEISCNAGLLAATILVPAVTLIITVLFLCRHLDIPWYLGMIWQWAKAKHRARMRHIRPEDLIGVEFHAFVSYSQHDVDWVRNLLLPNLEGPVGGLRVCHHEKSFVPGKPIIENIITCVEKSRCSVFVLSAHFIKSEWCHYELYFASHQRLSLGSDSIVLVLLEPLPQYLIPSKYYQLKSMMKRHTYLEWPQDKAKLKLFWANLRAALQADLPNAPE